MSNRYVTENEIKGARRRTENWRSRQHDLGRKSREIWATEDEFTKLKEFLEALRLNQAASSPAATGNDA